MKIYWEANEKSYIRAYITKVCIIFVEICFPLNERTWQLAKVSDVVAT